MPVISLDKFNGHYSPRDEDVAEDQTLPPDVHIICPTCGSYLEDDLRNIDRHGYRPRVIVLCKACDYSGFRRMLSKAEKAIKHEALKEEVISDSISAEDDGN